MSKFGSVLPAKRKTLAAIVSVCVGLTALAPPALALNVPMRGVEPERLSSTVVRTSREIRSPQVMIDFCVRHTRQCLPNEGRLETNDDGAVAINESLVRQIQRVHRSVNRSMRFRNDEAAFGVEDVWHISTRVGDCEDFALEKRRQLLARGWPSSALILALGWTSSGEGHAVLVVRTTSGDLVLDNMERDVVPLDQTSFRFHSTMSFEHPLSLRRASTTRI